MWPFKRKPDPAPVWAVGDLAEAVATCSQYPPVGARLIVSHVYEIYINPEAPPILGLWFANYRPNPFGFDARAFRKVDPAALPEERKRSVKA